jgi:transcriptional regulator with XRE-family HTH domain
MEHLLTDMGLRIQELRKQMDLTQEALAERAGMTSQTISTAELGKKALRPENIIKLSRALGVSTDYLLTGCRNSRDYTIIDGKLKDVSPQEYDRIMRMIDIMLEK